MPIRKRPKSDEQNPLAKASSLRQEADAEALEIGEQADHRVCPAGFESDAAFYRLQLDGKLLELPRLGS